MTDITFRNAKIEISIDGGANWTNISGQTNSVTVGSGDREIGTFYDAANDVPTLGAGKRAELEITLRVKYTEEDAEAQGVLASAYEDETEIMVRYSPKGAATGDRMYTSTAGFVKTNPYPGQEVESGDPLRHEFTFVFPLLINSLALASRILNVDLPNLVGYWKLDDSSSLSILDSSGNGYHGLYHPISIQNPGFETAGGGGTDVFANWSEAAATGTITRTTTAGEFRSGVAACKLTAGASADTCVLYSFACVAGQTYKLFFWTRGDGTNAGRYQVMDITHLTDIIARTSTLVTGTDYTMVEVDFTIPAGCTLARIYFWCPATTGGIACFDDVNMQFPSDFGHVGIDGRSCINFTGSNNIDLYSAGLISAMGGWTAGTILGYGKIAAPQWVDSTARYLFRLKTRAAAPNNAVTFGKQSTANNLVIQYVDTTVTGAWNINTGGTLDWFSLALTWDAVAGVAKAYYNGIQTGADFGTGTWSGAFDGIRCVIGGENNVDSTQIFIGYGQHIALWKTALSPDQIAAVSRLY